MPWALLQMHQKPQSSTLADTRTFKRCLLCGSWIQTKKWGAKYCSSACRDAFHYRHDSERKRVYNEKRRKERLAYVNAKKIAPCMDCGGQFDPVCMDFD